MKLLFFFKKLICQAFLIKLDIVLITMTKDSQVPNLLLWMINTPFGNFKNSHPKQIIPLLFETCLVVFFSKYNINTDAHKCTHNPLKQVCRLENTSHEREKKREDNHPQNRAPFVLKAWEKARQGDVQQMVHLVLC